VKLTIKSLGVFTDTELRAICNCAGLMTVYEIFTVSTGDLKKAILEDLKKGSAAQIGAVSLEDPILEGVFTPDKATFFLELGSAARENRVPLSFDEVAMDEPETEDMRITPVKKPAGAPAAEPTVAKPATAVKPATATVATAKPAAAAVAKPATTTAAAVKPATATAAKPATAAVATAKPATASAVKPATPATPTATAATASAKPATPAVATTGSVDLSPLTALVNKLLGAVDVLAKDNQKLAASVQKLGVDVNTILNRTIEAEAGVKFLVLNTYADALIEQFPDDLDTVLGNMPEAMLGTPQTREDYAIAFLGAEEGEEEEGEGSEEEEGEEEGEEEEGEEGDEGDDDNLE
jgi:hypothetical protein